MLYFIDTNIFLRVLVNENQTSHDQCKSLLDHIKQNKIKAVTGTVVLTEVLWTLLSYYKASKQRAVSSVEGILNLRGLKIIDNYDHRLALNQYSLHNVKYIDCLIASIKRIQEKNITVVSYDRDFDKLKVLRVEPAELCIKCIKG